MNEKPEIILSSDVSLHDQDVEDEIDEINKNLGNLCKRKGMLFIGNRNIKSCYLNRSKLHLNKSGIAF